MHVLQNVECISGLGIVVLYVAYEFAVPHCQVSTGLAYVRLVACFTGHLVYAAFVVFVRGVLEFGFDQLLQSVFTFKRYLYISLFEEFGDHPDFRAVISEGGPFIVVIGRVPLGFTLYLYSQSGYVVNGEFIVVCYDSYILPFCYSLFS
jgi:hypothetical protein